MIAELGHGGMADVFLAVMAGPAGSGFSKLTVIKRLRRNLAEDQDFIEMLVDEARISARLNHPNVVQTNEVGAVDDVYFIAMEYLDGQPLHRVQRRTAQLRAKQLDGLAGFPRECELLVLVDALAGLHHAHEVVDFDGTPLQIVHRDATPHNVFVTYDGQVKVVDFGIAKAVGRASETRQGIVKGTVRYMSPEQALGRTVDRRADVFSVGIMLWEAVTGRRMWKDVDDVNILDALLRGDVNRSPKSIDPTIADDLDRICQKALAHDREQRYATAEEFRLDLEHHLAQANLLIPARRKLGLAVAALFEDKRRDLRAVIQRQLDVLMSRAAPELRPVHIAVDSSSSSSLSAQVASSGPMAVTLRHGPHDAPSSRDTLDALDVAPPSLPPQHVDIITAGPLASMHPPRRSRAPILGVVAAMVAVLALSAFAVKSLRSPEPSAFAAGQSSVLAAPVAPPAVRVKLSVVPATARLTVDGILVSAPYDASVPRDHLEHHVHVDAPGHDPRDEVVRFDDDLTLDLALTKTAAAPLREPTAPSRAPAPRGATPPPTRTAPPREPAATPGPAPAAPPPAPAPTNRRPEIDNGDPWAGSGGR